MAVSQGLDGSGALIYMLSASIVISAVVVFALLSSPRRLGPKAPHLVPGGYPVVGALRFFTARWDFFQHARRLTPSGNFGFFIGRHAVVGLTGEKGRQLFFESKGLGFGEGYVCMSVCLFVSLPLSPSELRVLREDLVG